MNAITAIQNYSTAEPTIGEIKARVEAALDRMGNVGRFAFSYNIGDTSHACYVLHWFRPDPYAFEDCKKVGSGTVEQCLAAVDRYADEFRMQHRPMRAADIGLEAA